MPQSASCVAQIPCSLQTVAHVCPEMLQALLSEEGIWQAGSESLFGPLAISKGQYLQPEIRKGSHAIHFGRTILSMM